MSARMSTRGQRPAARAKASARAPRAVRTQPGRPAAANHVVLRRDAFESQADAFAARVAAGEREVARRNLLRADPGRFTVEGSTGRPLAPWLREELEPAFGADLRAVRLHTDQRAARAVDEAGADALAAGADVFFGSSRFDPLNPSGRDLLVHELAHVLQQTAVAGAGESLRARDVRGEGPAQASPGRTGLGITGLPPAPDSDEIIRRHEAVNPTHKPLLDAIAVVRAGLEVHAGDPAEWWTELEARVLADASAPDAIALALQVDLLKAHVRFEAVAAVVDLVPTLLTCFIDERAYTAWPESEGNRWLYSDWRSLPRFARFRPSTFLETYTTFLMGTTSAIPDFGKDRSYDAWLSEQLALLATPGPLVPNERTYALALFVNTLNQQRVGDLRGRVIRITGDASKAGSLSPDARWNIASQLVTLSEELGRGESADVLSPEVQALWVDLAPDLHAIAEEAKLFWDQTARFGFLLASGTTDPLLGDPAAILEKLRALDEVKTFEGELLRALRTLFSLPPADYLTGLGTLRQFVLPDAVHRAFEVPVSLRRGSRADAGLIAALGWVQVWTSELQELLAIPTKETPADALLAHRFQVARKVRAIGEALELSQLVTLSDEVLTATFGGQTLTQLAIVGEFQLSTGGIGRLVEDFYPDQMAGKSGFTVGELAHIWSTIYERKYEDVIAQERRSVTGKGKQTVLERALLRLAPEDFPQRWEVKSDEWEVAINPNDERSWAQVLGEHPKVKSRFPDPDTALAPREPWLGVVVWTFPEVQQFAERMQELDPFSVLVAAYRLGVDPSKVPARSPVLAEVKALDWRAWLDEFLLAAGEVSTVEAAPDRRPLAEPLREERDRAREDLILTMREASIAERHSRVEHELEPTLLQYRRYGLTREDTPLGSMTVFDIPTQVLGRLTWLTDRIGPEEERSLHMSAALLELAEALTRAFHDEPRFDVIVAYKPLLVAALADTGEDRRAQLGLLLPESVTDERRPDRWIAARAATLGQLIAQMTKREEFQQLRFGFEGLMEGEEGAVAGVGDNTLIGLNEPFTIDGVRWEIVNVQQPFSYHPRYGKNPSLLVVGGDPVPVEERAAVVLMRVRRGSDEKSGSDEKDVRGDDPWLEELAHAIPMAGMVKQLGELRELLIEGAELTMDVLELLPGGQILMATRLVAAIAGFINSPEYDELLRTFLRDPKEAFGWLLGLIEQLLTPELLWEWLLFGGEWLDKFRYAPKPPAPKPPALALATATQRIAGLIRRLAGVGMVIVRALLRTQTRVRWSMESIQLTVLRHPPLPQVLLRIADGIERFDDIDLGQGWTNAVGDFAQSVVDTALAATEFELPLEIIPMGEVVDLIVNLVIGRLPGKYRIAGQAILELLDLIGQRQAVFNAVAEAIPEGLNPNKYWERARHDWFEPPLEQARDAFAAEIFKQLSRFGPFSGPYNKPMETEQARAAGSVKIGDAQAPEPDEVQPLAAAGGGMARSGAPVALPEDAGRALAPYVRHTFERGFGQDFGHVRVHADAAAADAARRVGASALTSGSHVYLGAGVAPRAGAPLLAHELAHVVQQTGPRPLGRAHPATPVRGRPGRGLVVDPQREAAAAAAARGLGGDVAGGGAEGVQPSLPLDLIRTILLRSATAEDIALEAEKEAKSARPTAVPDAVRTRVGTIIDELEQTARHGLTFKPPLGDVKKELRTHLQRKEGYIQKVQKALDDILLDSIVDRRTVQTPTSAAGAREFELVEERFEVALGRTILGLTGLLLDIKLKWAGDDGQVHVDALEVAYVHLPPINGNSALWQKATEGVVKPDRLGKLIPRIKEHVETPSHDYWESTRFGLKQEVIDDVEKSIQEVGALDASNLPSVADYLQPTHSSVVGLRLGTHSEITGKNSGAKAGRESHHITQFLLLDFFTNNTNPKAFPLIAQAGDAYPGIRASEGLPETCGSLNLKGLWEGRGGLMPTINLARTTHRTGGLHITRADDFPSDTRSHTPGFAIASHFHAKLGPEYRAAEANESDFRSYVQTQGEPAVAERIHSAMMGTYGLMRKKMEPRLKSALEDKELPYYNKLADAKNPSAPHHIALLQMANVAKDAIEHSKTMLTKWGWTAS